MMEFDRHRDVEDIDLTSLRRRTWIDKQNLKWLLKLVDDKEDKELLSELSES